MKILRVLCVLVAMVSLSACQTTKLEPKDYTHFREVDPHSILVVPAVNRSVEVTAPDYYLSTISVPLAERGFYVFPVHLVKRVMEDDGLSDADMVHAAPTERLAEMFNADSVLYVTINQWDSKYMVLATETTVAINYVMKDGLTGEVLWKHDQTMKYVPQSSGGGISGLIAQAIISAVERAAPNYMPLARQANAWSLSASGQGMPNGPYSKWYHKDYDHFPAGSASNKNVEAKAQAQKSADEKTTTAQKIGPSL